MSRPRWQQPRLKTRENRDGSTTYYWEWIDHVRDIDGTERRIHRSQTVPAHEASSEARATRYYQKWLRERKEAPAAEDWTVGKLATMWFDVRRRSWSRNMRVNVLCQLDKHFLPRFRNWRLTEVRPMHIEAWAGEMADAKLSRGTAKQLLWLARSVFEMAVDNELIARNPARKVKPPASMPDRVMTQPYTIEEIDGMLAEHIGQDNLMLRVLLFCGLRVGEVCALRRDDLLDGGSLRVDESTDGGGRYKTTKTRKARIVPVPPELWRDLCEHAHRVSTRVDEMAAFEPSVEPKPLNQKRNQDVDEQPLFVTRHGTMFDPGWLWERLGLNLRRCRCTFASLLDADPADVRDLVGHSDVEMTMEHYRRGLPDRQRRAVGELERLCTGKRGKVLKMGGSN